MVVHLPQLSVHFLGTGGSWPSPQRNVAATGLKWGGEVLLFDCGEGTQRQFQKSALSYQAVTKVFISHLHGDHFYGLPGLFKTMQLNDRTQPLDIFGPPGIHELMSLYERIADVHGQYPIRVHEMRDGAAQAFDGYRVVARKLNHNAFNLGYRFEEASRPGRFDKPQALKLGVPEGPLFRKLQMGEPVKLKDGRTVTPDMVLGPPRPGRKIVVTGDTGPCEELITFSQDASLLVSEATYCMDVAERAQEYGHMTAAWAADVARRAHVERLALTHISPRYVTADQHLAEARTIYPGVRVMDDLSVIEVPLAG